MIVVLVLVLVLQQYQLLISGLQQHLDGFHDIYRPSEETTDLIWYLTGRVAAVTVATGCFK